MNRTRNGTAVRPTLPPSRYRRRLAWVLGLLASLLGASTPAAAVDMQVVSVSPTANSKAPVNSAITIEFDQPLDTTTITTSSFRVFGRGSGRATGPFTFSNGDRNVTLTPTRSFSAGEVVRVNLAHTIKAADSTPLRSAGYAFEFWTQTQPTPANFRQVDVMSNHSPSNAQTRIYGALASDFNGDGYLDLATVNEVSADVRVFLNLADGSGHFGHFLTPVHVGVESSPNEPADFNNDGKVDAVVSATDGPSEWILLGNGNGGFSSVQEVVVGSEPHGVAVLDVDGDGDPDIVNCNQASNNLSLLLNDGNGVFSAPTFFDSGADGEYGLIAGDVNNDGITDLVVGAISDQTVIALLGNGNGTFTPSTPQSSGGFTWVVTAGDVDGDNILDVAAANSVSGNVGVLHGNGDGTFNTPALINVGAHIPATDLGDLDGDGDLDLVLSSYGGGFWQIHFNDGSGNFSFGEQINAPSNPSCSILYDADNDGDLDLALSDEIADVVVLMENAPPSMCAPAAQTCRAPVLSLKSKLVVKNRDNDKRDALAWSWNKGQATMKTEFGDPLGSENYEICFYENDVLFYGVSVPGGGMCPDVPCWMSTSTGYVYKDPKLDPAGARVLKLKEGLLDGQARIRLAGHGPRLDLPDFQQVTGTLQVQLQKSGGGVCWGATYSPPFLVNDGVTFRAKSD